MVKRICILICFIQSFVAQYINAQTNISVLKEYVATPNLLINKLCLNEMIAEKYLKRTVIVEGTVQDITRMGTINSASTGIPEGELIASLDCNTPYDFIVNINERHLNFWESVSVGDKICFIGEIYNINRYGMTVLIVAPRKSSVQLANLLIMAHEEDLKSCSLRSILERHYKLSWIRKLKGLNDYTDTENSNYYNNELNPTTGSTVGGHEYYGMINEKYPIVMDLAWREPSEIVGSYYYVKNGRNNTLELSGSMNANDYMVLKEYNSAGENTGTFEGKWSMDSYSGTFTNYKGIKMPFKLYRETTATNNSNITFNSYQNSRFNYTVAYPSFLDKRQESENGDGCKFYMDDNTYLVVSGAYNALDESIVSRYYKCRSKPLTYSMQKDNWFVISDYTFNGNIFYTKTVLQNGVFFTATFYYPEKDKDKYNSVIKKIFTNFPS